MSTVIIYQTKDHHAQVQVQFEQETVWLNRQQLSLLFDRDIKTIGKHINNVFNEGELQKEAVVAKFATTAADGKVYKVDHYNLDVIISVGYRVKSKRGTQFRQWATQRLKEFLVEGYTINKKRLVEREMEVKQLRSGIRILRRTIQQRVSDLNDAKQLAGLLDDFSCGLELLDDYDHENLDKGGKHKKKAKRISHDDYFPLIDAMRPEFASDVFGVQKDQSFKSSVQQIYANFDGKDLYPSLEEKAAMLLYLVVKNHSFVDGNKRIAAACFLFFLDRQGILYHKDGTPRMSSDALASLTLFIAESHPEEMDTVKRLVVSVLNRAKGT